MLGWELTHGLYVKGHVFYLNKKEVTHLANADDPSYSYIYDGWKSTHYLGLEGEMTQEIERHNYILDTCFIKIRMEQDT